jgi:putative membrane protein (TIGR04086 family)
MQVCGMEQKEKKRPAFGWIFAGVTLLTLLAAAGLFLLWAWVSYHMRFSAEVIRAGLLSLYILPSLFGGKMLAGARCGRPLLWGAVLGAVFYAALLAASLLPAIVSGSGLPEPDRTDLLPLLLSVLSGALGAARFKKRTSNP